MKAPNHTPSHQSIPGWFFIIPPSIMAVLSSLFYYPSLRYKFQFDDLANITRFFDIRNHSFNSLFFSGTRWISYWINTVHYSFNKFNPFSYRVLNVVVHTSTSTILFFFLYLALSRLKKESFFSVNAFRIAFFTALLFLLHPVQTQTVTYVIQGQLEGISGLFITSMALLFLCAHRTSKTVVKWVLLTALFTIAFFSVGIKEICIVSPVLMLLVDWFFVAQGEWESLKKRLPLHAALFVFVVGLYIWLMTDFFKKVATLSLESRNNIGNVLTKDPKSKIKSWHYCISEFKVILHYLWIFLWPFSISVDYDWKMVDGPFSLDCVVPFIALLGISYGVYRLLRNNPTHVLGFGALWFFVALLPRASVVPSSELMADYKTYIGSSGWLMILAVGLLKLIDWTIKKCNVQHLVAHPFVGNVVLLAAVALPVGFCTQQRNLVWSSGENFWSNIVRNAPGKARAYNNLGVAIADQKRYEEAIPYFRKAISMDQRYPDPCNNLAVALSALGKTDEAIQAMKMAIKVQPYYPEGYNNLASFYIQKKEYENAEKSLSLALKLRPTYGKAHYNLGRIALEQGNKEAAWQHFKNACTKADFDNMTGFTAYGSLSMALKKYEDAIGAFNRVLKENPGSFNILVQLANAHFLNKDYANAEQLFTKILTVNPKDGRSVYNLAESQLLLQKPQEALKNFLKARELKFPAQQLELRIASCYEKVGKPESARKTLTNFIASGPPDHLKQVTQMAVTELDKAYGMGTKKAKKS